MSFFSKLKTTLEESRSSNEEFEDNLLVLKGLISCIVMLLCVCFFLGFLCARGSTPTQRRIEKQEILKKLTEEERGILGY